MFKKMLIVLVSAVLLLHLIPMEIILGLGLVLFVLAIVVFVLFHLGVQDFQGY